MSYLDDAYLGCVNCGGMGETQADIDARAMARMQAGVAATTMGAGQSPSTRPAWLLPVGIAAGALALFALLRRT
jgi:hypothetical protein